MQYGNLIYPFKNRSIDASKPVEVYRNLHAKRPEDKYSIRQAGLVVAHTNQCMLTDCKFVVSQKGQAKVRATKRKIVHALISGKVVDRALGCAAGEFLPWPIKISYNPYRNDMFVGEYSSPSFPNGVRAEARYVRGAQAVVLHDKGVGAAYCDWGHDVVDLGR